MEIEWRQSLIDQGKIRYIGGKQNMIKDGYFDDIDLAMMVHGTTCLLYTSRGYLRAHLLSGGGI